VLREFGRRPKFTLTTGIPDYHEVSALNVQAPYKNHCRIHPSENREILANPRLPRSGRRVLSALNVQAPNKNCCRIHPSENREIL
jgi:hypothetical protein